MLADLATFQVDGFGSWRPVKILKVEMHKGRAIDLIWILQRSRRHEVAKRLMLPFAEHSAEVADLARIVPFREDAVRFWMALGYAAVFIV